MKGLIDLLPVLTIMFALGAFFGKYALSRLLGSLNDATWTGAISLGAAVTFAALLALAVWLTCQLLLPKVVVLAIPGIAKADITVWPSNAILAYVFFLTASVCANREVWRKRQSRKT